VLKIVGAHQQVCVNYFTVYRFGWSILFTVRQFLCPMDAPVQSTVNHRTSYNPVSKNFGIRVHNQSTGSESRKHSPSMDCSRTILYKNLVRPCHSSDQVVGGPHAAHTGPRNLSTPLPANRVSGRNEIVPGRFAVGAGHRKKGIRRSTLGSRLRVATQT
jgi:hypothetical protein